ncbi:MAG: tetratricopeptide repeat protein [Bacteroidales bacterium]|nr:tetratricopeptide repeat protein [Bacteroidales bacterium]
MKQKLRDLLDQSKADEAIALAERYRAEGGVMDDELFYLLGNAWRKKGNWQMAMNNYLEAIHLNPDSPAQQALDIANEILAFYNKDMYNQ